MGKQKSGGPVTTVNLLGSEVRGDSGERCQFSFVATLTSREAVFVGEVLRCLQSKDPVDLQRVELLKDQTVSLRWTGVFNDPVAYDIQFMRN